MTLSTYDGRNLVDLRTWYTTEGRLKPGKGFAAEIRHLPRLAAALAKAEAKATELGLITDDDNDKGGRSMTSAPTRRRLPNRRAHLVLDFEHGGFSYTAGVGFFDDDGR